MRILFFNLNNSSEGTKRFGSKVLTWLQETYESDLIPIPEKTTHMTVWDTEKHYSELSRDLVALNPDVIVVNDMNYNVMISVYHHKLYHEKCKLLFIVRDWKYVTEREQDLCIKNFLNVCSFILTLNYAPDGVIPFGVAMDNLLFPVDSLEFNINIPWNQRQKKFVYLGDINQTKFSEEFVVLLKENNITSEIDCYGNINGSVEFNNLFNSCSALSYKGQLSQTDVAAVLNEYKYFVFPNNSCDKSNISLMQAMFCGVIPIILNKTNDKSFDHRWINWASGLYFGSETINDFFNNFKELINTDIENAEQYSNQVSNKTQQKSNYIKIKKLIIDKINN